MATDDHAREFEDGVRAALSELDGTDVAATGMLTGFTRETIDGVGDVPAEVRVPRAL